MATAVTITPSAGNAPFPTQGGVGASPGFDAIDYRRFWSHMYVEGVRTAAAWKFSEGSNNTDMVVECASNVAPAFVEGDSITDQGLYYVAPHSVVATFTIDPADGTNPRVDRFVLQVRDDAHDASGFTDARIVPLPGVPTSGASNDNPVGAVDVPDTALWLCDVEVPANATAITNSNIRDYRAYAMKDAQVGDLRFSYAGSPGDGWQAADFGTLSRAQHFRLFAAIGTGAGVGNGLTTFNKPDLRGRVPMGDGTPTGNTDGSNVSGASAHLLGQKAGHENIALSIHQLPTEAGVSVDTANPMIGWLMGNQPIPGAQLFHSSGQAHDNRQPYTVGKWYVFTGSVVG